MESKKLKMKVISIGGAGTSMINRIIETTENKEIDYISISTSIEELNQSNATSKLLIGKKVTKGLGTSGNVNIGVKAFKESEKEIKEFLQKELENVNIVFLVASLGGGTGTSVSPLVADIIKEMRILTIAVVSSTFSFQGKRKIQIKEEALKKLDSADFLIIIPSCTMYWKIVKSFNQILKDIDDDVRMTIQSLFYTFLNHNFEESSCEYLREYLLKRARRTIN